MASAKTVCDLLLPAQTAVRDKQLPAETVHIISSCRDSLQETIMRTVSEGSCFSQTAVLEGSKRSRTVSEEAKYNRQSQQGTNVIPCAPYVVTP